MAKGKYESPSKRNGSAGSIVIVLLLLLLVLVGLIVFRGCNPADPPSSTPGTNHSGTTTSAATTQPTTEATTAPTEPFVVSTASIGATGDYLMHLPVINAAKTDNTYDFAPHLEYISEYYSQYDFMVVNLETTLGSLAAGPYHGYPNFNCPDEIVDGLKNAGVDMILTANNHSYDTGTKGMMRTQQVIREKGLLHLGTREAAQDKQYIVQDINGIKVGMVCYTYETGKTSSGNKSLNGIPLTAEASQLISSFDYNNLDAFYSDITTTLSSMDAEGADANIVFIHWGDEYQLKPNSKQTAIAQQLCELGVDVIVGGHPHVIQPFDTLTSSTGHQTYCIYSVGNAISNQNRNSLANTTANARYTEDGMIFGVTFEKWNDGSVKIAEISILPTWVKLRTNAEYDIIPLDTQIPVWNCYEVPTESMTYDSYQRTMSIVGEGYNACLEALGLPTAPLTFEPEEP